MENTGSGDSRGSSVRDRLRRGLLGAILGRIDNRERLRASAVLAPDQPTAMSSPGPYYQPDPPDRRDVREDRDGAELVLRLRCVETVTQRPLAGLSAEIWHCDADGSYSGYQAYHPDRFPNLLRMKLRRNRPTDAGTFLRGRQRTDHDGRVEFRTVVPGWYTPRTLHIHCRIFSGTAPGSVELACTELYFPDGISRQVLATPPYARRGPSPFTNTHDVEILLARGRPGAWLDVTATEAGYRAEVTVRISPKS